MAATRSFAADTVALAALFRVPADYRKVMPPAMHLPGPRPKP